MEVDVPAVQTIARRLARGQAADRLPRGRGRRVSVRRVRVRDRISKDRGRISLRIRTRIAIRIAIAISSAEGPTARASNVLPARRTVRAAARRASREMSESTRARLQKVVRLRIPAPRKTAASVVPTSLVIRIGLRVVGATAGVEEGAAATMARDVRLPTQTRLKVRRVKAVSRGAIVARDHPNLHGRNNLRGRKARALRAAPKAGRKVIAALGKAAAGASRVAPIASAVGVGDAGAEGVVQAEAQAALRTAAARARAVALRTAAPTAVAVAADRATGAARTRAADPASRSSPSTNAGR